MGEIRHCVVFVLLKNRDITSANGSKVILVACVKSKLSESIVVSLLSEAWVMVSTYDSLNSPMSTENRNSHLFCFTELF